MTADRRILRLLVALLALGSAGVSQSRAAERTAADVLPATAVAFAEIRQPQELLETVYDHPLVARFESLDPVRAAMEKKPYLDFKAGVAIVESQVGLPWRKIIGQAAGGGLALAVDGKTQGVALLVQAADPAAQSRVVETLVTLAGADAKSKGKPEPFKASEYRGVKVYAVEKGAFAVVNGWLVATNKEELGKQIVDRILDGDQRASESLAGNEQFAKARQSASKSGTAWAYLNTAAIRDAGLAKKLFGGQADNPLAELLFGGVLSTLQHTPNVAVGLDVNERGVLLSAATPHDRAWAGESREYFFGPQGGGAAPAGLLVDDAIASLCAYRDISAMWLRAGDLLSEKSNEELAKADSGLTTIFSGKDFGEDILGALKPEIQLVVARQEFAAGKPAPALKLPAFGLVAELRDPAKMQPELRRTFQNLIGFFNVVGAMNGQPQLELDMENTDAAEFVTATHLADPNAKDPTNLKINYNFSPSIGFAGSRLVLASTTTLAHTLATAKAASRPPGDAAGVVNTAASMHAESLRETLADNRGQLVAQNMLKEGHSKEEAEKAIGVFLELVGWFDGVGLSLDTTPSELRATLDVRLKAVD